MEGRLERIQGSGTFVAQPKLMHVRQLTSFSQDLDGQHPTSVILSLDQIPATQAEADKLGVRAGARVHRLERLRCLADEPLAHERPTFPGSCPDCEPSWIVAGPLPDPSRGVRHPHHLSRG